MPVEGCREPPSLSPALQWQATAFVLGLHTSSLLPTAGSARIQVVGYFSIYPLRFTQRLSQFCLKKKKKRKSACFLANRLLDLSILLLTTDGVLPTPGFAEADVCAAAFALHADERVHCLLFVLHKKCKTLEQAAKICVPSIAAAGGASREGQVRGYPTGWHSAPLNIRQEGAQELVALQEREECIDLILCCHRRSH